MHRVRNRTGHDLTAVEDDGRPYVINHMDVSSGTDDADKTGPIQATSDKLDGRKQFDGSVDIDDKRVIFEIDTAASLSVVGERQLAKFPLWPTIYIRCPCEHTTGKTLVYWGKSKSQCCMPVGE